MPGLSEPGVGGVGDSYDNALAETVNGLYASNLRRSIFSARPRPRFTRTMAAGRRGRDVLEDHLAGGSAMPAVPITARMLSASSDSAAWTSCAARRRSAVPRQRLRASCHGASPDAVPRPSASSAPCGSASPRRPGRARCEKRISARADDDVDLKEYALGMGLDMEQQEMQNWR